MKFKQPDTFKLIVETKAANKLINVSAWFALQPFSRDPITVAEASERIQERQSTVTERANRLSKLGLLEVVDKVGRSKRYRTTADSFVIPLSLLSDETARGFLKRLDATESPVKKNVSSTVVHRQKWAVRSPKWEGWGALIHVTRKPGSVPFETELVRLDAQRNPVLPLQEDLLSATSPAIWSVDIEIGLDTHTAKQFQKELSDLTAKFRKNHSLTNEPYKVILTMMPQKILID